MNNITWKFTGGTVIEKINSCTVLVTNKISRSLKFLLAMALGKPIVDVNWIDDSLKEGRFLGKHTKWSPY